VTWEQATAEFVRHYRLMVERTGDDPGGLTRALGEHPNLGASIKRLGGIVLAFDRHRRTAQRRYIYQAHPEFREALKDFDERWRRSYNEIRDRMYSHAVSRISEELIRAYRYLIERTANDPSAVERAREIDPALSDSIGVLQAIDAALNARGREFGPFLLGAPDEFRRALADFRDRWVAAVVRKLDLDSIPILDLDSV
jgi:hypothetical protein